MTLYIGDIKFKDNVTFDGYQTLNNEGYSDDHLVTKSYVDGGGDPKLVTQEAFTITVSSIGVDPLTPIKITSQAEADAHGTFLTVGGAIATLYDLLLKHIVTIQLPAGTWNLAAGELDQVWRVSPTYYDGRIRIRGASAWEQIATTSEVLAVSSNDAGDVVLAVDPFAAVDAKATYMYVVSGTGSGQFEPIRTHSGVNATIAGHFNPALDGTSLIRIAKPSTTLVFNEQSIEFSTGIGSDFTNWIEFWHLDLNTNPAYGWFGTATSGLMFHGGTRFINIGIYTLLSNIALGDVIFDSRDYPYEPLYYLSGEVRSVSTGAVIYFLADNFASSAVVVQATGYLGSAGVGAQCVFFNFPTFDGFLGSYIKAEGNAEVLLTVGESYYIKSDQGGSAVIELLNGASARINSLAVLEASTCKGVTSDINLDGSDLLWSEVDADPDKSMMSQRGSIITDNNT